MRLTSITVENYRSITKAHRIPISELTVVVGPNNEGKSNILRALVTAMSVLTSSRPRFAHPAKASRIVVRTSSYRSLFDWEKDFPVHLQGRKRNGQSVIILDFKLTSDELQDFRAEIRSKLNDSLPIKICLGPREVVISVNKKGPGGPALTKKSSKIAAFVAARLEFEHIPAVRTAGSAEEIITTLVARELRQLEENQDYVAALKKIGEVQRPVLEQLSASVKQTLVKFLPKVVDVTVGVPEDNRFRAMRRACEIVVDDGTPTLLSYKGDGVQSLAALALMRHAAETAARGKHLVIAIEEPESHLHSSAIHEIRDVLAKLSQRHQVVITTHNALFVDRVRPAANILVSQRKARPARNVAEIRDILGVRAADNLRHAALVILVEGEEDIVSLQALLGKKSKKITRALTEATLAFDSLNGASNLGYKLGLLRAAICGTHCVLDDDSAGRKAFNTAEIEGLTSQVETNFLTCPGKDEAELEDLIDPAIYVDMLKNRYGIGLSPEFRSKAKWSSRMRQVFKRQGKQWTDAIESEVKLAIARKVAAEPDYALYSACRASFDALAAAIEGRLDEISAGRTHE